ncbi:MAG: type II secretion system protein GspK [Armatimonadetes bacterium]|nr:type II secretion system protein GspK [Armatimonadota bacterium]
MVLSLMVLLALLAAGLALTVRNEHQSSSAHINRLQARFYAYAGIQRALYELSRDHPGTDGYDEPWALLDSRREEPPFSDGYYLVRVVDESGKLNLNTAGAEELRAFFRTVTGDDGLAQELTDSLLDWRDTDSEQRTVGAEADYYLSLSDPYRPRNGPLITAAELLLIKGFEREIVYGDRRLGTPPLFELATVFSQSPNIDERGVARLNINSAGAEELRQHLSDVLTEAEINALIRFREQGPGGGGQGTSQPRPPASSPPSPGGSPTGPLGGGGPLGTGGLPRPTGPGWGGVPGGSPPLGPPQMGPQLPFPTRQRPGPQPSGPGMSEGPQLPEPQQQEQRPSSGAQRRTIRSLLELEPILPRDKLVAIWERLTTRNGEAQDGLINLNTAPPAVLSALLADNEAAVEEIVRLRQENGSFASVGQLLTLSSVPRDQLQRLMDRVCTKTASFRLKAIGVVGNFRATYTIEAVVRRQVPPAQEAPTDAPAMVPPTFVVHYWRER